MKPIELGRRAADPLLSRVMLDVDVFVGPSGRGLIVQGNSGAGKSRLLRRILEQTHGQLQHLIIDPEGEYPTLRARFDYVVAAKGSGDTPADPRSAALLAERLFEHGASAILDLYELKGDQRVGFVKAFLGALLEAPRNLWHPTLVVVDEAHLFCPEKGDAESADAVKDLSTRGRKRGLNPLFATQRLSAFSKDAAGNCNNKLIGRTSLDVDLKRASDELGFTKERWPDLRKLGPGHFFAYGPALSLSNEGVVEVHIGATETQQPGSGPASYQPPPPSSKILAFLPTLADLPAEAEARAKTLAELEGTIAQLRRELRQATSAAPPAPPPQVVEVPAVSKEDLFAMEDLLRRCTEQMETGRGYAEALESAADRIKAATLTAASLRAKPLAAHAPTPRPEVTRDEAPRAARRPTSGGPEQKILNALAELEQLGVRQPDRVQVAFLAGYTNIGSKGFKNAAGALRTAGHITYPSDGTIALTEIGQERATYERRPSSAAEVQDRVMELLGGVHSKILKPLLDHHPRPLERTYLAERTGYGNVGSKGFKNALGRLRSLGFVEYPNAGQVRASALLFPGVRA